MTNKYPSRYSNGKQVSAAQYITEVICEHKAKIDGLDLNYKFWISKEWDLHYRSQISSANKLLKKYSASAIIKALNDKKSEKIYSLRAPHLLPIIEKYEKILASQNLDFTKEIDRQDHKTHRRDKQKQNIISKLKELDNGI